ncbi:nicotinic acid mononucleotide adenyltransferase [Leptobacterium flavescens]|uniref:Nicotinic acid mononucleotide adenyltransferase n=1 Tax=Leptobacterium flavescens TaxID=472055 RepID=A0A6P0UM41_9FLAO|nr:nicotinic acid mononucleotide adenyltransferase [Leptobacterium flavescens]NER14411.1 nicotinic acid mononucleotide adenyltransferase [Leptobacterium flavescens]
MKAVKLLFGFLFLFVMTVSCDTQVIIEDDIIIEEPVFSLNQLLTSYDLWYVNINETTGNGEVPFLQKAFTVSFRSGVLYANNNLVGIGDKGNGLGIDIGDYDTYGEFLEVSHDADGYMELEVFPLSANRIRMYHRPSNTSYYLTGYYRHNFDYDLVFYDNITYFLQEYEVWEKTYTSQEGAINKFDAENFLQFLTGDDTIFRSSTDKNGTGIDNIFWDYEGVYSVQNVKGDLYVKTLTLDYDFLNNDYFELTVINDNTIELFHPNSGTVYEFKGRGYIEFLRGTNEAKKREKKVLPTMSIERKSERKSITI